MSDEELNELEHAARTSVAGGLAWRLGKALASVRAERDEQESAKNAERDALRAVVQAAFDMQISNHPEWEALARAALNKGGGDE